MRERPILFSAPMVRAILSGAKTQTRRIVKGAPDNTSEVVSSLLVHRGDLFDFRRNLDNPKALSCPYGAPGDRLWVREAWAAADRMYQGHDLDEPRVIAYPADRSARRGFGGTVTDVPAFDLASWNWDSLKGRPSIHMPRWASRISLEVTAVRVERLQAISTMDAMAEGVEPRPVASGAMSYTHGFRALWDSINGARASWASNPWVWAVEFKRTERGGGEG